MTPDEFSAALALLGWKQSDFARKTGLAPRTPSRWMTKETPIPEWVPAYLGAMQDLALLHAKYIAPVRSGTEPDD